MADEPFKDQQVKALADVMITRRTWDDVLKAAQTDPVLYAMATRATMDGNREAALIDTVLHLAKRNAEAQVREIDLLMRQPPRPMMLCSDCPQTLAALKLNGGK